MTRALRTWWEHLSALAGGTAATWWRCLPAMICGLGLGMLGYHALLVLSAFISADHPWLAVATLSLGFACLLVGYLFCLRAVGRDLAIGDRLLRSARGENLVDESLTRLVAVTLLPFIGIYAVFGKMQETSAALVTYEVVTRGIFEKGVLSTLNPTTSHQRWVILWVLLGAFVLRRLLDGLLERTGRRVFGILTGLVETFFTLVLIYGGTRLVNHARSWLADRRVAAWWRHLLGWVADGLRHIAEALPHWIGWLWSGLVGPVWHAFSTGIAQPLLWLAIAAIAFGSRVLSASELFRETIGDRPTRLQRVPIERFHQSRAHRVWTEFKELFFGDLDDKYLPTVQSLKLVLSAGVGLVGAFCLLHAVVQVLDRGALALLHRVIGADTSEVWVAAGLGTDLFTTLVSEPVRLALLGVTYLRCLHLLEQRAAASPEGVTPPREAWRSRVPDGILAVACAVLAGAVVTWAQHDGNYQRFPGRVGQRLTLSRSNQGFEVTRVTAAQRLAVSGGRIDTLDRFLVLHVVLETPGQRVENGVDCTLHQGAAVLQPALMTTLLAPEPGFRSSVDLVFERPVTGLVGATLVCHPTDWIRSWSRELVVDLGIDQKAADAWSARSGSSTAVSTLSTEQVLQ